MNGEPKKQIGYDTYWLTPVGSKSWKKKIDAILKTEPPKTIKRLRGFIGAINCYRDMSPRRSHILGPLADAMGQYSRAKNEGKKLKSIWTKEMQKAFEEMEVLLTTDSLTAYPDHNIFSKYILMHLSISYVGACIVQEHNGV